MSSLAQLHSKIDSVVMVKKISTAMRFASQVALFRQMGTFCLEEDRVRLEEDIIAAAWFSHGGRAVLPEWMKMSEGKPRLYVVYGPEKGFCGDMTERLIQHVKKTLAKEDMLWVVGANLLRRLRARKMSFTIQFSTCPKSVGDIPNLIQSDCLKHDYSEISFIYPHYISMIHWEVREKRLFPFSVEKSSDDSAGVSMEDEEKDFWSGVGTRYLHTVAKAVLAHKNVSEFSSRMTAMDKASRNAEDMHADLRKIWQKKRQEMVTNELLEVTAGAVAIEGG